MTNKFIPSTHFIEKLPNICVDLELISVYDTECYSVSQMVYILAQKINDTITNMEHNDTALKAHLEDLQAKLEYLLGEGLVEEVQRLLDEMYADGSLLKLVDKAMADIKKRLNAIEDITVPQSASNEHEIKVLQQEIVNKMDKNTKDISIAQINKNLGKIDSTYLSDELIAQMAGTTPVSPNVADKSITLNKLDDNLKSDIYEINKTFPYGQLLLVKEDPKVNFGYYITTSSAITVYKNGTKWSFKGVSDYEVGANEWLYCDLSLPSNNSEAYELSKSAPLTTKKDKIVVFGNFYGKYFTDLFYEKVDKSVEKLQFKTTMLGFKNSDKCTITFNEESRLLKVDGDGIYIRRNPYEASTLKSILIPPFEYTLKNFEIVYVKLSEIDFTIQEVSVDKIRKAYIYETGADKFNPIEDVPLFWYSAGVLSNNLGLEVEKIAEVKTGSLNVACFGDSLTELDKYPEKMASLTGFNVYDCSFAGSVMAYHNDDKYQKLGLMEISKSIVSGNFQAQRDAIDGISGGSNKEPNFKTLSTLDFNKIDVCVVLYGTNDWGNGGKLGSASDSKDTQSLVGGMKTAIENILSKYPHLQFYFVSPPYRQGWENLRDGKNLKEWGNTICEVSNLYGFPSMNGIENLGINEFNAKKFLDPDILHLNSNGDALFARKIGSFIQSR